MDFDSYYLKIAKYTMIASGLWPGSISNTFLSRFYTIYKFIPLMYFTIFNVTFLVGFVLAISSLTDNEKSDIVPYLLVYTLSIWKCFLIKGKSVRKMMSDVAQIEKRIKETDRELYEIYKNDARYNFKLVSLGPISCISAISLITAMGVKGMLHVRSMEKQGLDVEKPLIFPEWFPNYNEKYYSYYYLYQLSNAALAGIVIEASDTLIIPLIMFSACYMKMLGTEIERFGTTEMSHNDKMELLRSLILKHKYIIKHVETLNNNFRWMFLVEFTVKSFQICQILVAIFEVSGVTGTEVLFNISKIFIILLQGMVTYTQANRVTLEGENLSTHIYNCQWSNQPVEVSRSLLIMMIRTRKPLRLECVGIVVLSNALSLKIIQAVYTYIIFSMSKK